MAAAAILDFKNLTFITVKTVKKVELHQCGKFCRNRLNRGRDIVMIFGFFNLAAAVIIDFKIFKFLTVGHAKKVERLDYAKFRLILSSSGRDMVIS